MPLLKHKNAITIMTTAIMKWEAASQAADCCGFSSKTVRQWASSFVIAYTSSPDNITDNFTTEQLSSKRGHRDTHIGTLLHDEDFQLAARSFVRKHACKKGEPKLTCRMFADWVNAEYGLRIDESTARRWMITLGFPRVHHQKGVYSDGHDRDNVVMYRNSFLKTMEELDKRRVTVILHNWH